MRSSILSIWQWVGDRVLGAAGRGARLDNGTPTQVGAVPGQAIRRPFEVIDGGKIAAKTDVKPSQPVRPIGPYRPTRRAG